MQTKTIANNCTFKIYLDKNFVLFKTKKNNNNNN